jgi:hypothetical protein
MLHWSVFAGALLALFLHKWLSLERPSMLLAEQNTNPKCTAVALCAPTLSTGRADLAVQKALGLVQTSLQGIQNGIGSELKMGLMSVGLLDGLDMIEPLERGFFTASGLGQSISDSDELVCKSKDFFGDYFSQGWQSATVVAENRDFGERWALFNDTLPIRRCLSQNLLPGHERAPECVRAGNRTAAHRGCEDAAPCPFAGGRRDPLCGAPQGGVCGMGFCWDVYTPADLSMIACLAWRKASARLAAWPADGGLQSLALYARLAVFSLLQAHATILTRSVPSDIPTLRKELIHSSEWITARLDLYDSPTVQLEIIHATSTKAVVKPADFDANTRIYDTGFRLYIACGDQMPQTDSRPYRHFLRYGCPARADAPLHADGPSASVVGYIQKGDDKWCRGAVNCTLHASPTNLAQCTIWAGLAFKPVTSAQYVTSVAGSACQANFFGLKSGGYPNECVLDGNADKCNKMGLACHAYMEALWEPGINDARARLPQVITEMHAEYRAVAGLFAQMSNESYKHVTDYAQKKNWPLLE